MKLNEPAMSGGDWCEIEPDIWFYFEPMPLSDDEVIARYRFLCAEVSRLAQSERELQSIADGLQEKKSDIVVKWMMNHQEAIVKPNGEIHYHLADGRDMNSVAPKTTKKLEQIKRELEVIKHQYDKALDKKLELIALYPVTIRRISDL